MSLKISRILHAGYIFECDGSKIAFDPLFENPFSRNCYAFPAIEFDCKAIQNLELDAVFISHYHDDHFSLESLNYLKRETPIYIFSVFPELLDLIKNLGFTTVHAVSLLKPITVGTFEILALEALDADVDSIYHIKAQDKNILNVVDSWIGPRTFDQLLKTKWDLIMWPMQSMREIEVLSPSSAPPVSEDTVNPPPELMEQLQKLKPLIVIPSACQFRFEDWSWYNQAFFPITYAKFQKILSEILPQTKVLRINPGKSFQWVRSEIQEAESLSWIRPVGPQDVDYQFNPQRAPQSISEIAQRLPKATFDQKNRVQQFCLEELGPRYSGLSNLDESYFSNRQKWQLTIYDEKGLPTSYFYDVLGEEMKMATESPNAAWVTEIPEVKLYNAIEEGESLTSIYMRVTNPENSDPLEDPLIRSLYEGILGGYQKAQLKKLGFSAPRPPLPFS